MIPTVPSLVVMLAVVLALSGAFMRAAAALARSRLVRGHRARVERVPARVTPARRRFMSIGTSVVSTGLVFAFTLGLRERIFVSGPVSPWRVAGEAVAILAVYDLAYYLFHRFVLHAWSVGRRIHAVHHAVRAPFADDSLYVHPAETAGGVGLFLAATWLVGPVGVSSFAVAFLAYSVLNVWVHSAIDLPYRALRPLTTLVRHHDVHHESMKSGYYASLTPLWDVVFRTTRS